MSSEPRDYLNEAEEWRGMSRPIKELLSEDKKSTMEKLFGLLNHNNPMTRKTVAYALGQIGDTLAIEQLELRLRTESIEGARDAMKASLAALKKFPADKGYSDLQRRQHIADVYSGKLKD